MCPAWNASKKIDQKAVRGCSVSLGAMPENRAAALLVETADTASDSPMQSMIVRSTIAHTAKRR